jgi:hypothetical protein
LETNLTKIFYSISPSFQKYITESTIFNSLIVYVINAAGEHLKGRYLLTKTPSVNEIMLEIESVHNIIVQLLDARLLTTGKYDLLKAVAFTLTSLGEMVKNSFKMYNVRLARGNLPGE